MRRRQQPAAYLARANLSYAGQQVFLDLDKCQISFLTTLGWTRNEYGVLSEIEKCSVRLLEVSQEGVFELWPAAKKCLESGREAEQTAG